MVTRSGYKLVYAVVGCFGLWHRVQWAPCGVLTRVRPAACHRVWRMVPTARHSPLLHAELCVHPAGIHEPRSGAHRQRTCQSPLCACCRCRLGRAPDGRGRACRVHAAGVSRRQLGVTVAYATQLAVRAPCVADLRAWVVGLVCDAPAVLRCCPRRSFRPAAIARAKAESVRPALCPQPPVAGCLLTPSCALSPAGRREPAHDRTATQADCRCSWPVQRVRVHPIAIQPR